MRGPFLSSALSFVVVALSGQVWACRDAGPEDRTSKDTPASSTSARARQLRFDAGDELDKHHWTGALELLDQAKALDPPGDDVPWIHNGRTLAHDGLSRADR